MMLGAFVLKGEKTLHNSTNFNTDLYTCIHLDHLSETFACRRLSRAAERCCEWCMEHVHLVEARFEMTILTPWRFVWGLVLCCFVPLRVGSLPLVNEQRFTGRDLVLLKAVFVTGWWPNPTLGWQRLGQQGVAFTGGMKVPWIPCSLRCSIVQTLSTSFYILLIWFLQDFCVQVPSRDNILMNLQWSNAQWESTSSTWSKRTAFLDGNFCEAMGPKLGRINTLWTQGAQPQALPTPCSCSNCSSVTLWMSWRKNFPLMSIEPQSHLVNLSQTQTGTFFFAM